MDDKFHEKLISLDRQLRELRKEIEDNLKSWSNGNIPETKCLWDNIPPEDRYKPMSLSCPCRKCSAYC